MSYWCHEWWSEVLSHWSIDAHFCQTDHRTWTYVLLFPLYRFTMPSGTIWSSPHHSLGSRLWFPISSGIHAVGLVESIERNKEENQSDPHWSFEPYRAQSSYIPTEFWSRAQRIDIHHSRCIVWDQSQALPPGLRVALQDCHTVTRWFDPLLMKHRLVHWSKARQSLSRRVLIAQVFPL